MVTCPTTARRGVGVRSQEPSWGRHDGIAECGHRGHARGQRHNAGGTSVGSAEGGVPPPPKGIHATPPPALH